MVSLEKTTLYLIILFGLSTSIFSQNEKNTENRLDTVFYKHNPRENIIGLNIGFSGMATGGILKNKAGSAIFTAHIGITYNHYFTNWLAINTGFILHTELYSKLEQDLPSGAKLIDYMKTPFCFTIPVGVNFNIPGAEWLYIGVGLNVNIPIANLKSMTAQNYADIGKVFIGIPIDLGVDLMKPNRGGSRLFLRVTPTFHKETVFAPVGLVWQYNWRVTPPKIKPVVVPVPVIIVK
jgi:hypothetical protein